MKQKFLSFILTTIMLLGIFVVPAYASEANKGLVIRFKEFKYTIDNYDASSVYVEYTNSEDNEIATIKRKDNNAILEQITNSPVSTCLYNNNNNSAYIFTRDASFGSTSIRLTVIVELYTNGSFRQINSIRGKHLGIVSSVAPTEIENSDLNVWGNGGKLPAVELLYGYSGTLVAKVDSSLSSEVSLELMGSGFALSKTVGSTTYYRLPFNGVGRISLY